MERDFMKDDARCMVCGSGAVEPFLHRRGVVVQQNVLVDSPDAARQMPRGDLHLHVCTRCGFLFNAAFNPTLIHYDRTYDNQQHHSPAFAAHTGEMAQRVCNTNVHRQRVFDIGCGQGDFLRLLLEQGIAGEAIGYDPSCRCPGVEPKLRLEAKPVDNTCAERAPVVICRHVIEHVSDPMTFLRDVRQAATGKVFFEMRNARWVLQRQVVYDFYYEQRSYFTAGALAAAFAHSGFQVGAIHEVFDGQYLWLEGAAGNSRPQYDPGDTVALARAFGEAEGHFTDYWRKKLRSHQRVALWGAAAKGVTFANMVDPDCQRIAAVIDTNPSKQGRFLPGTGHAIVAPSQLPMLDVGAVLAANPHYIPEIQREVRSLGLATPVIGLVESDRANAAMVA